jgi:hypothetical protein
VAPRTVLALLIAATVIATGGCGAEPAPYRQAAGPQRSSPTALPTRSVAAAGYDHARIPERFTLQPSGPYWVQLFDPADRLATIVVGIEPSRSGADLEAAVAMQRQEMDNPPQSRFHESGEVLTEALGAMRWTRSSYRLDELEMQQLALFGAHPADGCLVIARSEYPGGGGERQAKLDELVAIASVIGPGL